MSPGQERAVWKLFYLLSQVVGHEHVTEDRDFCRRFNRLAERMNDRANPARGMRSRAMVAELKVETAQQFLQSIRATVGKSNTTERQRETMILKDVENALALLGRKKKGRDS